MCWAHLRRTFADFVARGDRRPVRSETARVFGAAVYLVPLNPRGHPATIELPGLRQAICASFVSKSGWAKVRDAKTAATLLAIDVDLRAQERRRRANNAADAAFGMESCGALPASAPTGGSRFVERMLTVRETGAPWTNHGLLRRPLPPASSFASTPRHRSRGKPTGFLSLLAATQGPERLRDRKRPDVARWHPVGVQEGLVILAASAGAVGFHRKKLGRSIDGFRNEQNAG